MIINYFMNFSPYFEIRNQREGWMNHIKLCEVSTWQEHWSIAKRRFLDRCNIEQWWRIKPSNIIIFTSVNKPTKIVIYIPGIFKAKEGEESFLSWSSLRSWHRMFNGCFFPWLFVADGHMHILLNKSSDWPITGPISWYVRMFFHVQWQLQRGL